MERFREIRQQLVDYDKQTSSRWSQLFGNAVSGPMKGEQLVKLPSTMTTWAKWKALHPNTTVYVKLEPLVSTYSLWFAWKKYRPDTEVYGEDSSK